MLRRRRGGCFVHGPRYWMLMGGTHGARADRDCRCALCLGQIDREGKAHS